MQLFDLPPEYILFIEFEYLSAARPRHAKRSRIHPATQYAQLLYLPRWCSVPCIVVKELSSYQQIRSVCTPIGLWSSFLCLYWLSLQNNKMRYAERERENTSTGVLVRPSNAPPFERMSLRYDTASSPARICAYESLKSGWEEDFHPSVSTARMAATNREENATDCNRSATSVDF